MRSTPLHSPFPFRAVRSQSKSLICLSAAEGQIRKGGSFPCCPESQTRCRALRRKPIQDFSGFPRKGIPAPLSRIRRPLRLAGHVAQLARPNCPQAALVRLRSPLRNMAGQPRVPRLAPSILRVQPTRAIGPSKLLSRFGRNLSCICRVPRRLVSRHLPPDSRAHARSRLMREIQGKESSYFLDWEAVEVPNQKRTRLLNPFQP